MDIIRITETAITDRFKKLAKDSHKGSNGFLNIVAGCERYRGAAALCVSGALRTGCGIVRLISEEKVVQTVAARHPSCTFLPVDTVSSLTGAIISLKGKRFLIGCGLGVSERSAAAVNAVLAVADGVVIDADALNIISLNSESKSRLNGNIITPHVGEFSRLTGLPIEVIKNDPFTHAACFSEKYGCVTVLKDSKTFITTPSGACYLSESASEGLSKGGSGDVLAGIIAGIFAQGYSAEDAAVIGVAIHAFASVECAAVLGKRAMLPSDLEHYVARLLNRLGY